MTKQNNWEEDFREMWKEISAIKQDNNDRLRITTEYFIENLLKEQEEEQEESEREIFDHMKAIQKNKLKGQAERINLRLEANIRVFDMMDSEHSDCFSEAYETVVKIIKQEAGL